MVNIGFSTVCGFEHPLGVLECAPVGRGPTVFGLVLLTLWDTSPMGAVRGHCRGCWASSAWHPHACLVWSGHSDGKAVQGLREAPGEGKTHRPKGVLEPGQSLPGLELAVLQVAQGMLESPLAEAGGQVAQTHEVAALVGRGHPGPKLSGCQLS